MIDFMFSKRLVHAQFSTTLKVVRSDNRGEYVNQLLQAYFQDHDIIH